MSSLNSWPDPYPLRGSRLSRQRPVNGSYTEAHQFTNLPDGLSCTVEGTNFLTIKNQSRATAELHALTLCTRHTCPYSLADEVALELREGGEHVELELARSSRRVEAV